MVQGPVGLKAPRGRSRAQTQLGWVLLVLGRAGSDGRIKVLPGFAVIKALRNALNHLPCVPGSERRGLLGRDTATWPQCWILTSE